LTGLIHDMLSIGGKKKSPIERVLFSTFEIFEKSVCIKSLENFLDEIFSTEEEI